MAARDDDAPTVISLFAGGGGSSLGYSMAGYRELLAVEWNNDAAATLRSNFPRLPIFKGGIADLSTPRLFQVCGIGPGELDVLDGSPPCQGFSDMGKRNSGDSRNGLYREYLRILRATMPRAFVMENVPGMLKGKRRNIFISIISDLRESGYMVRASVLNAVWHGVPQDRKRLIFIGIRRDVGIEPSFPDPSSRPIPLREAWEGIKHRGHEVKGQDLLISRLMPPGSYNGRKSAYSVSALGRKVLFDLTRVDESRPCRTIMKSRTSIIMQDSNHYLSIQHAKRASSYQDPYDFQGSYSSRWDQIGNSVPPFFMRAIAMHLREALGTTSS